jgi:hypothetical protein
VHTEEIYNSMAIVYIDIDTNCPQTTASSGRGKYRFKSFWGYNKNQSYVYIASLNPTSSIMIVVANHVYVHIKDRP